MPAYSNQSIKFQSVITKLLPQAAAQLTYIFFNLISINFIVCATFLSEILVQRCIWSCCRKLTLLYKVNREQRFIILTYGRNYFSHLFSGRVQIFKIYFVNSQNFFLCNKILCKWLQEMHICFYSSYVGSFNIIFYTQHYLVLGEVGIRVKLKSDS